MLPQLLSLKRYPPGSRGISHRHGRKQASSDTCALVPKGSLSPKDYLTDTSGFVGRCCVTLSNLVLFCVWIWLPFLGAWMVRYQSKLGHCNPHNSLITQQLTDQKPSLGRLLEDSWCLRNQFLPEREPTGKENPISPCKWFKLWRANTMNCEHSDNTVHNWRAVQVNYCSSFGHSVTSIRNARLQNNICCASGSSKFVTSIRTGEHLQRQSWCTSKHWTSTLRVGQEFRYVITEPRTVFPVFSTLGTWWHSC